MRLNRGEDSPINYPNLSSLLRDTWRPTRAPTWPRGLPAIWRAPCASCVGRMRPATWPQCHVVTARWSCAPRRRLATSACRLGPACHVISRGLVDKDTPLFRDFNKEIHLKITLKIQIKIRKRAKTLEIHISQNTTPFNLKFSPLDHKFLPF